MNLPPQGSFDHPKGGYVCGFLEDMFLSCERSAGKSLADHLLKDDNRLEKGVQPARRECAWAINPGGLCCLSDNPQAGFQAMVQIHARVGILGPHVGFDPFWPSQWGCWAKSHGTHNAPLFQAGEFNLPLLEKYRIFNLLVIGNGGLLMLACFNVHVFGGFSIFGNAFSTDFRVSHGFVTLIKGCMVTDFFFSLAGFEFSVDEYG